MPTESSYARIDIPPTDIWGLLFERKDRGFPDNKVIYVDPTTPRSYTYTQVRATAIEFGKGLRTSWEWKKGDVLATFSPNCIDMPAVIWGCLWAGGIVSSANPGYTVEELVFQLKDSSATAIVTHLSCLDSVVKAAQRVGIPENRVILIGDGRDSTLKYKHFTSIVNTEGTSFFRRTKINPEIDLAFIVYSSGTTGLPKGVMLSHKNIVANILMIKEGESSNFSWNGGPDGRGDNVIAFLPFFHIYGLTCLIHQALYSGLTLTVMPKFDIEQFCSLVQEHKITFAYVVPPVLLLLGKHPIVDKYDLSSLRMMNCGAAPLTCELVETVYERLKIPVKQGYGLSETSPVTHTQSWDRWQDTMGSVGTLLPNQTTKFMSAAGEEVPHGQLGELWIKGPNIFKGYLNNIHETRNALMEDGYLKTGDIGYQDTNGNFYITDRCKELIKYKGFQVPPAELEGVLLGSKMVADAAVVGVWDASRASEVPRAYIVPSRGVDASPETERQITQWFATKVASHKQLRGGIKFIDAIPKTASGKILRRVLKPQALPVESKEIIAKL